MKRNRLKIFGLFLFPVLLSWIPVKGSVRLDVSVTMTINSSTMDTATFGAGCFWCVEAIFQQLDGVTNVVSGYAGGHVKNPNYSQVCTGETGHAEVCFITYDPVKISYTDLLQVFWSIHDPTTLNRQGADVGTQYRSVIFYHNDEQRRLAMEYRQRLDKSGAFGNPVVTEIVPMDIFYPAEDYHQKYFINNTNQPYCRIVIQPKLEKFKKAFAEKIVPPKGK